MEGEPDNGFCKLFAVLCLNFFQERGQVSKEAVVLCRWESITE